MWIDKNRHNKTINSDFGGITTGVTDTFVTLLFANPQHLVQHYIQSRTLLESSRGQAR